MLDHLQSLLSGKHLPFSVVGLALHKRNLVVDCLVSDIAIPQGSDGIHLNEFALVWFAWALTQSCFHHINVIRTVFGLGLRLGVEKDEEEFLPVKVVKPLRNSDYLCEEKLTTNFLRIWDPMISLTSENGVEGKFEVLSE